MKFTSKIIDTRRICSICGAREEAAVNLSITFYSATESIGFFKKIRYSFCAQCAQKETNDEHVFENKNVKRVVIAYMDAESVWTKDYYRVTIIYRKIKFLDFEAAFGRDDLDNAMSQAKSFEAARQKASNIVKKQMEGIESNSHANSYPNWRRAG
jgi:hypothetical protein